MTTNDWYLDDRSDYGFENKREVLVYIPVARSDLHRDPLDLHELIAYVNRLEKAVNELVTGCWPAFSFQGRVQVSEKIKSLKKILENGGQTHAQ